MMIDFEKKREQRLLGETGDGEASCSGVYDREDFLYPAESVVAEAIEEAEMKDELIKMLATELACVMNLSGLKKDFYLNDQFSEMLRYDEINDIDGPMFISEDGDTVISVRLEEEKGGPVNFDVLITDQSDGRLRIFNEGKWEEVDIGETFRVPADVYKEMSGKQTLDFNEKTLLLEFCASREHTTTEDWNRFRAENAGIIKLIREAGGIIRHSLHNGVMYAIPEDEDHAGVAISADPGGYAVWQMLTDNGILREGELIFACDRDAPFYLRKVFVLGSEEEARRFVEEHMDRNTLLGKAITVPVTKDIVLHLGEDAIDRTDLITDNPRLSGEPEEIIRSACRFAEEIRKRRKRL